MTNPSKDIAGSELPLQNCGICLIDDADAVWHTHTLDEINRYCASEQAKAVQEFGERLLASLPEKYDEDMIHVNSYPSWWDAVNAAMDQTITAIQEAMEENQ